VDVCCPAKHGVPHDLLDLIACEQTLGEPIETERAGDRRIL
jgi:hypothetical protein